MSWKKAIGYGILGGIITFLICGDVNSATAVGVLITYMEKRLRKNE